MSDTQFKHNLKKIKKEIDKFDRQLQDDGDIIIDDGLSDEFFGGFDFRKEDKRS